MQHFFQFSLQISTGVEYLIHVFQKIVPVVHCFILKITCLNLHFKLKKILKAALSCLRQFLVTESTLKMMKNAFYFISKALFVLKIFKFLSWLFGHVPKRLDKEDEVNFKSYDVTAWLTNNCIGILSNIWKSKGNQTIKFRQLIECNARNIFLEKWYTKCAQETSPRPFSEKLKLSISLNQQSRVLYSLLLLYAKLMAIKIYWN